MWSLSKSTWAYGPTTRDRRQQGLAASGPRSLQLGRPVAHAFLELAGRPDQGHRLRHPPAERVLVQPVAEDGLEDLLQFAEGELLRQELESDVGAPDLVA